MGDATVGDAVGLRRAAEELGVHYMTAYRYVRSGRLPARKAGGEWRVDPADLRRVMSGADRSHLEGAPPRTVHRERLESRLIAGDEPGAWQVVEAALASGGTPSEVLAGMLVPSLRSIGERWAAGGLSIADEHRASAVAQRLIARMGPRLARPGRRRGSVVLGSAAGDLHSLPTAILSDLLRAEGLEVVDLGADCPASVFLDAAELIGEPCVLGVCVTAPEVRPSAEVLADEVRRARPDCVVVLGGGGVDGPGVPATPEAAVEHLVELAVALRSGARVSDPGVPRSTA